MLYKSYFSKIRSIACSLLQIFFLFKISDCVGPDGSPKKARTDTWAIHSVYKYIVHVLYGEQFAFLPSARWDLDQRLQPLWMWQWFHECPVSACSVPHDATSQMQWAWTKAGLPDIRLLPKPVMRSVTVTQTLTSFRLLSGLSYNFFHHGNRLELHFAVWSME